MRWWGSSADSQQVGTLGGLLARSLVVSECVDSFEPVARLASARCAECRQCWSNPLRTRAGPGLHLAAGR